MPVGLDGMDPNSLQQKALEAARKAGEEHGAGPMPAATDDVARFQDVMQSRENPVAASSSSPVNAAPPLVPAGETQPALGDRILSGMSAASEHVQAGRAEAAALLGKSDATQADLLRANFAMMESSTMVSAIAKTTEKITQGIKTLQQG